MSVTISKLADRVGVSRDALRYYERRGLLPAPDRSESGYRLYDDAAVERLGFIKDAQRMGLRLDDVKELLEIMDRGACPCGHTAVVVDRRLAEIGAELDRLETMRRRLAALGERNRACARLDPGEWWCATRTARGGDPS